MGIKVVSLEVWRLAHFCLMWCIWREWNAISFEDRETSVLESNNFLFKSLYFFRVFGFLFFFSILRGFSCILVDGCAPLPINEIELLIEKKKKKKKKKNGD
jgi:hypothetical protein